MAQDVLWTVTQALTALSDNDASLYNAAKRTLENCHTVRLALVMLDNELSSEKLSFSLFKALSDHIVHSNAETVQQPAVEVLVDLLQQSEAVPLRIITALGSKLAAERDPRSPAARLLERVIQRAQETIDVAVGRLARVYISHDHTELQKSERSHISSALQAIAKHCSAAAHSASTVLTETLSSPEVNESHAILSACSLGARLLREVPSSGFSEFHELFNNLVSQISCGITEEIRLELVRWARSVLLSSDTELPQIQVKTLTAALAERVLDTIERVRRESSVAICEIAEHNPERVTTKQLVRAVDRIWDKKQSVRKEVYKHLCKAHMAHLRRISKQTPLPADDERFEWIVPILLDAAKTKEMAPLIFESAFVDDAIQLSKISADTVAQCWINAWTRTSDDAKEMLRGMLRTRKQLRDAMHAYFNARHHQRRRRQSLKEEIEPQGPGEGNHTDTNNEEKALVESSGNLGRGFDFTSDVANDSRRQSQEGNNERQQAHPMLQQDREHPDSDEISWEVFDRIAQALPGISDAADKMARMHTEVSDSHFFRSLKVAMGQDAGSESARKTLDEVTRRVGGQKKQNGEFARQLCMRLFNAPFTSEVVHILCSRGASEAKRSPKYATASLELLELIAVPLPPLFKTGINDISSLVQKEQKEALSNSVTTSALKILAAVGRDCQAGESKRARNAVSHLKGLARGAAADRAQAKAAAGALLSLDARDELEAVVHDAISGFHSGASAGEKGTVTDSCSIHIAAVGQAFLLDDSLFTLHGPAIMQQLREEADKNLEGTDDFDADTLVALAKALSRATIATSASSSENVSIYDDLSKAFSDLLAPSNSHCEGKVRIEIALQVLRLAQRYDSKMHMSLLLPAFLSLGSAVGDATTQQAQRAIKKLHERVAQGVVPGKWCVALALAGSRMQSAADALQRCIARFRSTLLESQEHSSTTPLATMPEYMVPFLVSSVAANPAFPSKSEASEAPDTAYTPFAEDLACGLEALLQSSGIQPEGATMPAVLKMLRHTKLCVSANDSVASTAKMHCVADLGIEVVKQIAERKGWEMGMQFPGQVPIPSQILQPEQSGRAYGSKAPISAARKTDGGTLPPGVDVSSIDLSSASISKRQRNKSKAASRGRTNSNSGKRGRLSRQAKQGRMRKDQQNQEASGDSAHEGHGSERGRSSRSDDSARERAEDMGVSTRSQSREQAAEEGAKNEEFVEAEEREKKKLVDNREIEKNMHNDRIGAEEGEGEDDDGDDGDTLLDPPPRSITMRKSRRIEQPA
jgi:hypothetical protein